MSARKSLLAQVHIGAKDLGLDEEVYRALLERITGHRSAGALDVAALERVTGELRRLGWQPKSKRQRAKPSDNPQARMIWGLWSELCRLGIPNVRTRRALRAFCNRITGVEEPDWLNHDQAHAVIESLKHWRRRALSQGGK